MQLTFVIIILILLIFYVVAESIDDASPPRKDSKTSKQARERTWKRQKRNLSKKTQTAHKQQHSSQALVSAIILLPRSSVSSGPFPRNECQPFRKGSGESAVEQASKLISQMN
jgi:Na+-transporting methylmalonyl-CoA/oxaloacetate decarboxylase gamma subunit